MANRRLGEVLARLFGLTMLLALILDIHLTLVRPAYLNWGATMDERRLAMTGDLIVPAAEFQQTRAITINAPVEAVWPWLAQTGQDRGGFYSFDLLENLVGARMPTTDALRPEKQQWNVGDKLWLYPSEKASGLGFVTLRDYAPGKGLGFGGRLVRTAADQPDDGSWSMAVEPIDGQTSRLLIRGRGIREPWSVSSALAAALFDPMHYVMERRMMIGLKNLVETGSRYRTANHIQVGLWILTLGLAVVAGVLVLVRRRVGQALFGFVLATTTFQILTLRQPSLVIGVALVLLTALSLIPMYKSAWRMRLITPSV